MADIFKEKEIQSGDFQILAKMLNLETNADADLMIEMLRNELDHTLRDSNEQKTYLSTFQITPEDFDESVCKCLRELAELQFQLGSCSGSMADLNLCSIEDRRKKSEIMPTVIKLKHAIRCLKKENERTLKLINEVEIGIKSTIETTSGMESNKRKYKLMREKIKTYEETLKSLEKSFPNCKSAENDITKILEDFKYLGILRKQQREKQEELSQFHGISTNVDEARHQLEEVKQKYEQYDDRE